MDIGTLEIRNYVFKPGTTEHFIDYFEAIFVDTLEAAGMAVLGQFRLLGQPDRFVWIRGFRDMDTRLASLTAFYNGDVWKKYRPGAVANMLDSTNVRLVRPCGDVSALTCGMTAQRIAADLAAGTISQDTGVFAIDIYHASPGLSDVLSDLYESRVAPHYHAEGVQLRGTFVTELGENKWTRHPAMQNPDEFVAITAYPDEDACREIRAKYAPLLEPPVESLILAPTLRSPIRM